MFKKLICASILASYALGPEIELKSNLTMIVLQTLCYGLMLYFDFSGYSDMAIGLSRLFGFEVPENFNHPFLKRNLIEFWNAWHMSFSNWLRIYIFMPVGQKLFRTRLKKHPLGIATLSYLVTFVVCGLWHGLH